MNRNDLRRVDMNLLVIFGILSVLLLIIYTNIRSWSSNVRTS